jgi:hypothetical protein
MTAAEDSSIDQYRKSIIVSHGKKLEEISTLTFVFVTQFEV